VVGVEAQRIGTDEHRARDDGDAELAEHVEREAPVRGEVAGAGGLHRADHRPGDHRAGEHESQRGGKPALREERQVEAARHQPGEDDHARDPAKPAMHPRQALLDEDGEERDAGGQREDRGADVHLQRE
jgi:hypothetical protein